ncbi:MAG: glycosyltransferase family 4 protein [Sphingomicrobium sp.]|nr:glycosyltransferase family 4 protein [Sphingomonadales bacterium]
MRILFALPGLHAVHRGAEVAFLAVATELARMGHEVTLIGSGPVLPDRPYRYLKGSRIVRERFESFPRVPVLRSDTAWEELSFLPSLLRRYRPADYDVTVTCSYPFTNWALRRPSLGRTRPRHIFVTQNGDWPVQSNDSEYRLFGCDGLVCINPDFLERNQDRFRSVLIPNGVDTKRFTPGPAERARFGIGEGGPVVLMVSAMIASKNVADGIRAVVRLPEGRLVVAGDGPLRGELQALAEELMPGRYQPVSVASQDMPALYRSADAFLHLSRDESFGNVYVEAMACGVPTVAYDLPRTRWIMGEEAFLADAQEGDVAAMLTTALRDGAARRDSMVTRAASFDWSRIAARYLAFFEEVVRES